MVRNVTEHEVDFIKIGLDNMLRPQENKKVGEKVSLKNSKLEVTGVSKDEPESAGWRSLSRMKSLQLRKNLDFCLCSFYFKES